MAVCCVLYQVPPGLLVPSFQIRSKKQPIYHTTWCQGLGEAHIARLALHLAPPIPVGTVTMETSEFLHITGEPGCQQLRLWRWGWQGEAEGSRQYKGLAHFTGDCGEGMDTSAAEVPWPPPNLTSFSFLLVLVMSSGL
jgi:hypothetical protein